MKEASLRQVACYAARKLLNAQISVYNRVFNASTRFSAGEPSTHLVLPLCISTGFGNTLWKWSWKTHVIARLSRADQGAFIDVGANVGQTLLDVVATNSSTTYVGFEPLVANAFYLKELIRANALSSFRVVPAGLANEAGCVSIYRKIGSIEDAGASLRADLRPARDNETDLITCLRFDDIRDHLGLNEVSFIKIDVEGAELEVVTGMKQCLEECRPIVLCEVLFTDPSADLARRKERNDRLARYLHDMRYVIRQLIKSPGGETVVDARAITAFDSAYWSVENGSLCDYLFVPEERDTDSLHTLLS